MNALGKELLSFVLLAMSASTADWPQPRHDDRLTAVQPVAGAIKQPRMIAEIDLGRVVPPATQVMRSDGEQASVAIVGGELRCYDANGRRLWATHPAGVNFTQIITAGDLDGDGRNEIALQAGRPAEPFGAAMLVSVDDGKVLWRYDVEPMSYAWYLHVFDGERAGTKRIFVVMHGYPPDAKNGYCVMFTPGAKGWGQKWRYDFDQYTCFPNVQQVDIDGDGHKELSIVSHSRMWLLDQRDGTVKQFIQWDTSPANVRSYGLNQFIDLNGDGRPDFLCLGYFSKHYEVLLNENGKLKQAWHYGWPESVMTGKVALTWPTPAVGDVDRDGKKEVVVSMFNAEGEQAWAIRVHDATTGALKYKYPGFIAARLVDEGGGMAILADRSDSGSDADANGGCTIHNPKGSATLKVMDGALRALREEKSALASRDVLPPAKPATPTLIVPAEQGSPPPQILAADVMGEGKNQLLLYRENKATVWALAGGQFVKVAEWETSCLPVLADLDGDGKLEVVLSDVGPANLPRFKAITPAQSGKVLWNVELPSPNRAGLPQPRIAYMRPGHFTGRMQADIYAWVGTPIVRSLVLRGDTGAVVWEKGQIGQTERYWGSTHNLTSAADVNGDGKADLIFTDPDEYCVASGTTGEFLVGPLAQSKIFNQPSQGLYTFPAVLDERVCLAGGHYFRALLSLDAKPGWYALPVVGEARCADEGFLQLADGSWLMGFGRQDGKFACLNLADGSTRWEMDLAASASDVTACDIDGDGAAEFIFGTSHGDLYAVGDREGKPRVSWKTNAGAGLGAPVLADIDGDGKSDVIVAGEDGHVRVFGPAPAP